MLSNQDSGDIRRHNSNKHFSILHCSTCVQSYIFSGNTLIVRNHMTGKTNADYFLLQVSLLATIMQIKYTISKQVFNYYTTVLINKKNTFSATATANSLDSVSVLPRPAPEQQVHQYCHINSDHENIEQKDRGT